MKMDTEVLNKALANTKHKDHPQACGLYPRISGWLNIHKSINTTDNINRLKDEITCSSQ